MNEINENKSNMINENLRKDFDALKLTVNCPKLYVSEYFTDLRNQIDIQFEICIADTVMCTEQSLQQAQQDRSVLIEYIEKIEKRCLENVDQEYCIFEKFNSTLEDIETLFNDGKFSAKEISEGDNLIYKTLVEFQKTALLNKQIIFVSKTSGLVGDFDLIEYNELRQIQSFGILILIEDEFIGDRGFVHEYNSENNHGPPKKFNIENLKSLLLKSRIDSLYQIYADSFELCQPILTIHLKISKQSHCDMSEQNIIEIDRDLFQEFVNLTDVDLSFNKLTHLDPNVFKCLKKLERINLNNNKLTKLDSNLFHGLTNLLSIYLTENNLTKLDASIFQGLNNLRYISFSKNKLTSIESGLFQGLKNLRTIFLCTNELTFLDSQVFQGLNKLESIYLSDNLLTELDSNIFTGLGNLKSINLKGNQLTRLDSATFETLKKLEHINLEENRLTCIDADIFRGLTNLRSIILHLEDH